RGNGKNLLGFLPPGDLSGAGLCHWRCGDSIESPHYRWGVETLRVRSRVSTPCALDALHLEAIVESFWAKSPIHRGHSGPAGLHFAVTPARAGHAVGSRPLKANAGTSPPATAPALRGPCW